jgi:WD40 repeat protein
MVAEEAVVMAPSRLIMACAVVGLVAGCAFPRGAARQGSVTQFTVPRFLAGTAVRSVAPRNGLIAFTAPYANTTAIYTVQPDGSGLHRLPLPVALLPTALAWSPDGIQIAFAATDIRAHEDSNLYVVQADGHGLRRLTHGLLGVGSMTWSPDSQWIAFTGDVLWTPAAFAIRVTGTGLHRILAGFSVSSLAWGPVGLLAFSGTRSPASARWQGKEGVWTARVSGRDLRRVTGPVPPGPLGPGLYVLGWSPDGRSLLIQDAPRYGELSVIPAAGGPPHVLLDCPMQTCTVITPHVILGPPPFYRNGISNIAWSPDGRIIVCTVGSAAGTAGDSFYTVPAAGGRLAPLRVPGRSPENIAGLSWQPA